MRIIGGKFKGKVLRAPRKLPVRPTMDSAKEALFNILSNWYDFEGMKVLDLFAGTGNIGYEFWSRGIEELTSVDQNSGCQRYIKEIFNELEINGKALRMDANKFVNRSMGKWDLIFMDPPYGFLGLEGLLNTIFSQKLLKEGGLLILEHPSQENYEHLTHFQEARKYGGSVFSFFEN